MESTATPTPRPLEVPQTSSISASLTDMEDQPCASLTHSQDRRIRWVLPVPTVCVCACEHSHSEVPSSVLSSARSKSLQSFPLVSHAPVKSVKGQAQVLHPTGWQGTQVSKWEGLASSHCGALQGLSSMPQHSKDPPWSYPEKSLNTLVHKRRKVTAQAAYRILGHQNLSDIFLATSRASLVIWDPPHSVI